MENRINQVMTLDNGKKFMILHQAIYNNENYYVCSKVTPDGKDLEESFNLFREVKNGEELSLVPVGDPALVEFILKHLSLID